LKINFAGGMVFSLRPETRDLLEAEAGVPVHVQASGSHYPGRGHLTAYLAPIGE
jgi:hypothetical protein